MAHPLKVLLVEDDLDIAELTAAWLKSHRFEVNVAYTGSDALKKVEGIPDIILLDITLPDMEGYDVCRKIRENKKFQAIPIIMVSARDALFDRVEGLEIGADDYVTKPFDSADLLARIKAVLRRSQSVNNKNE